VIKGTAIAGVAEAELLADKLMEYRLLDGGVLVSKPTTAAESRLVPYFANLAALGWVETAKATTDKEKRNRYLEVTRLWIEWYASHQNPDGTIYDFEGPTTQLKPTGSYDSTDSYAATYALLLWRYFEATEDLEYVRGKLWSLNGAYDAVLLTMDDVGLTYAHPHYAYRFLMDNCEVAAGFVAFDKIYTILNQPEKAAEAMQHIVKLKDQFSRFYRPDLKAFGYAIDPFGHPVETFTKGYPDAMANLFAITFLAPEDAQTSALLNRVKDKFWSQPDAQEFPQWWTWPAMICGNSDLQAEAMEKLQAQAEQPDAHSYLVGMAAATHVSGVDSIRFPKVVCSWQQLTAVRPQQAPKQPESGSLVVPGSSIVITGHKAAGTLGDGGWQTSDAKLPVTVDYAISTKTGYLQVNLVWPQPLDLSSATHANLTYEGLDGGNHSQLQVTFIEEDGDWWDAAVPTSQPEPNKVELDFKQLKANPWGKAGDQKMDLSSLRGIRFQIANKAGKATTGTVKFSDLKLHNGQ
jgi:hypothetical protein